MKKATRAKTVHGGRTDLSSSEEPRTKSGAIFQALLDLHDPNASSTDVREYVIKQWPSLRQTVESDKNWTAYVTQARDRAAQELGKERTRRRGRRAKSGSAAVNGEPVKVEDMLDLAKIRTLLKNDKDLAEVVILTARLGPMPRIRLLLDRYVELMKQHGQNAEKVEQVLWDMKFLLTGKR